MRVTKHAYERFHERITEGPREFVRQFIEADLRSSIVMKEANGISKRRSRDNQITYVCAGEGPSLTVITLYLEKTIPANAG